MMERSILSRSDMAAILKEVAGFHWFVNMADFSEFVGESVIFNVSEKESISVFRAVLGK